MASLSGTTGLLSAKSLSHLDAHPCDLKDLLSGDGRGLAHRYRREKSRRTGLLALILLPEVHLSETRPAKALELAEVVELQHAPSGEHLDALLGKARRAVSQIMDR